MAQLILLALEARNTHEREKEGRAKAESAR
jgi:hypothetical protein